VCGGSDGTEATTEAGARGSVWPASGGCLRLPPMAIHPDLLEILACPVCKTPVELVQDGAGLRCAQCKRVYPVREDIPIMLPEEATVSE
jgi:uncharacterized protein